MKSKSNSHNKLEKFKKNTLTKQDQASIEGGFFDMFSPSFGTVKVVEDPNTPFPRVEGDIYQGFVICVPTSGGSIF